MAANILRAEVYRESWSQNDAVNPYKSRGWRWRLIKGRNIIAVSSEAYNRRRDAIRGLEIVTGGSHRDGEILRRQTTKEGRLIWGGDWDGIRVEVTK